MDNNCIHKVYSIFRAVIEFERAVENTFNININELMLLCMLANKESLLAGEIASEMGLTRSIESDSSSRTKRIPGTPHLQTRQPVPTMPNYRKRTTTNGTHKLQNVSCTTKSCRLPNTKITTPQWQKTVEKTEQYAQKTQNKRL